MSSRVVRPGESDDQAGLSPLEHRVGCSRRSRTSALAGNSTGEMRAIRRLLRAPSRRPPGPLWPGLQRRDRDLRHADTDALDSQPGDREQANRRRRRRPERGPPTRPARPRPRLWWSPGPGGGRPRGQVLTLYVVAGRWALEGTSIVSSTGAFGTSPLISATASATSCT